MDVSIIIINYNTCQMTNECINSICEKTKDVEYEIILIDNASKDGSKDFFKNDTRICYIYSPENMGFGRANNVGMMLACGKYFLLLNSDTILINNAVKIFYDYVEKHEQIAFYGCWLEDLEGHKLHSCGYLPTLNSILLDTCNFYGRLFYRAKNTMHNDIPYNLEKIKKVGYITGANLFIHRRIYERTAGFDYNFFMYFEESDWQCRGSKLGFNSYVINGPRIVHFEGYRIKDTNKKKRIRMTYNKYSLNVKSEKLYVKKRYSKIQYLLFSIIINILNVPILLGLKFKDEKRM